MPITFYSRKLTPPQQNYTVEVFKEFCQMLLSSKLVVYTDPKSLTHHMMQL